MSRNTLLSLLLVILVVLGGAYALNRPKPETGTPPPPSLVLPAGKYVEHAAYYDIAANYATSTPLTPAANQAAIMLMQSFIADTIRQFKENGDFEHLTPADIQTMGGRKQALEIKYLYGYSARTISYIYTVYEDTLGAHGNTDFKTFTFDTASGKALSLSDLFLPGSDYLGRLSSISRTALAKSLGSDATQSQISAGTTPIEANFGNFLIDNRDFVLLFPPYQVAAYAAGPQTVRMPLSQLSDILKPEYR